MVDRRYRLCIDADRPPHLRLPLTEFARQTRDLVDLRLRTPWKVHHSSGRVQQVPPIDSRFQLDQVLLRTDTAPPEIHIIFRWAGGQALFGIRERVEQDDYEDRGMGATTPAELASLIVTELEENLLARGYGIENARREPHDNVTWLDWVSRSTRLSI